MTEDVATEAASGSTKGCCGLRLPHNVPGDITESIKFGEYDIFMPTEYKDDSQLPKLIRKTAQSKICGRVPRIVIFLSIPIIFFPVLAIDTRNVIFPIGRMYGFALLLMFLGYYGHMISLLIPWISNHDKIADNDKYLYRIYSLNSNVPQWSNMSIGYRCLLFKQYPIESVSEFGAVHGGMAQTMILSMNAFAWALLIVVICLELSTNDLYLGFGIMSQLIGCFGLVLTSTFELDAFNHRMRVFHRIGLFLTGFLMFGFLDQQIRIVQHNSDHWWVLLIAILILIIGCSGAILWLFYFIPKARDYVTQQRITIELKNEENNTQFKSNHVTMIDTSMVHKLSLYNIASETAFSFSSSMALCLWLINNEFCYCIINNRGCDAGYNAADSGCYSV